MLRLRSIGIVAATYNSSLVASFGRRAMSRAAFSSVPCNGNNGKRSLIVDTDMGFDDLLALHLLQKDSSCDLKLITTVSGINIATYGAECAQRIFGPKTIVASGDDTVLESQPWLSSYRERFSKYIDSKYGAIDVRQTEKTRVKLRYNNAMREILTSSYEGSCDLLCFGPLTNVASWLEDKDLATLMFQKIGSVYILGGTQDSGKFGPEFNFECDSVAANIVLQSPTLIDKINLVTADVSGSTSQCELSNGLVERIEDAVKPAQNNGEPHNTLADIEPNSAVADVISCDPKAIFYDPVCAFAYLNHERLSWSSCRFVSHVEQDGNIVFLEKGESGLARNGPVSILTPMCETNQDNFVHWITYAISIK